MISRSLKHISNAVTNPTNWFVAACFAVCLCSTMRLLDTRPISISQTADAAEASARNSAHLRTNSELDAAKTLGLDSIVSSDGSLSASVKSKTVLTPIEELEVGMRVRADSPNGEFDDQFGTEVIPSEWRKLTLTSPKKNGTLSHITLLRPLEWIEREKAVVDGHVYITVPECGIDGNALIHLIEPCPEISTGEGQVVTGTFQHQVKGGIELEIEGELEPIRCTANHPFWDETAREFVRADSLYREATVRTAHGLQTVNTLRSLVGRSEVINIEVFRNHVYHVGDTGILVHNGGPCPEHGSIDNLVQLGIPRRTNPWNVFQSNNGGVFGNTSEASAAYSVITGKGLGPDFITKTQADALGWNPRAGNLGQVAPGKSIGGDVFQNRQNLLPSANGRIWYEADLNYRGGYRGKDRLLFSSDGLVFISRDHYRTFIQVFN